MPHDDPSDPLYDPRTWHAPVRDKAPAAHPALTVDCDLCDQPAGSPCITGGDPDKPRDEPHKARRDAYEAAGDDEGDSGGSE